MDFGKANCKQCGLEFTKHRQCQRYHSPSCANIAKQSRKRRNSAKRSGVANTVQNHPVGGHLEVVSRAEKTSTKSRRSEPQKLHLYLHDEAPAIGCGWRTLTVTMSPRWVRLLNHHTGDKKRITHEAFKHIVDGSAACINRNSPPVELLEAA